MLFTFLSWLQFYVVLTPFLTADGVYANSEVLDAIIKNYESPRPSARMWHPDARRFLGSGRKGRDNEDCKNNRRLLLQTASEQLDKDCRVKLGEDWLEYHKDILRDNDITAEQIAKSLRYSLPKDFGIDSLNKAWSKYISTQLYDNIFSSAKAIVPSKMHSHPNAPRIDTPYFSPKKLCEYAYHEYNDDELWRVRCERQMAQVSTLGDILTPPLVHFIWIGSSLPKKYLENLQSFRHHNPAFGLVLWTDRLQSEIDSTTLAMMHKTDVIVLNVDNIARKLSLRAGLYNLYTHYQNSDAPAFMSDILRVLLLKQYGGFYADVDINCRSSLEPLLHFKLAIPAKGQFESLPLVQNNNFWMSAPGHTFLDIIINYMVRHTEVKFHSDYQGRLQGKKFTPKEDLTMVRSGPIAFIAAWALYAIVHVIAARDVKPSLASFGNSIISHGTLLIKGKNYFVPTSCADWSYSCNKERKAVLIENSSEKESDKIKRLARTIVRDIQDGLPSRLEDYGELLQKNNHNQHQVLESIGKEIASGWRTYVKPMDIDLSPDDDLQTRTGKQRRQILLTAEAKDSGLRRKFLICAEVRRIFGSESIDLLLAEAEVPLYDFRLFERMMSYLENDARNAQKKQEAREAKARSWYNKFDSHDEEEEEEYEVDDFKELRDSKSLPIDFTSSASLGTLSDALNVLIFYWISNRDIACRQQSVNDIRRILDREDD